MAMNFHKKLFIIVTLLFISASSIAREATHHDIDLAKWTDPLTPPQGPWVSCSKWAKPFPGTKICVGHTYRWKYMDCKLFAKISTPKPTFLLDKVKSAIGRATVKTALVELLKGASSGGASTSTAGATFVALLTEELQASIDSPDVKLHQSCGWSAKR